MFGEASGHKPGEGNVSHSSVLAWRIPQTGGWRATVHGAAKSQTPVK